MEYVISERSPFDFEATLDKVRAALDAQGFDLVLETDLGAAMREALEESHLGRYVMLSACSATLAREALDADAEAGVLLPSTVVVREDDAGVVVEAVDPTAVLSVLGNPELSVFADDAKNRLTRVVSGATVTTEPAEA